MLSFSSSATWNYLKPSEAPVQWDKVVWFRGHVSKHAFTFWIVQRDRLPVRKRLLQWRINTTCLCCNYSSNPETRDHLLLQCDFSKQVWNKVLLKLGHTRNILSSWTSLINWLSSRSPPSPTILKRLASQATVFYIWREMNTHLHMEISSTPESTFKIIDRTI